MKRLLLILFVAMSYTGFSQSVSADLYVGQPYLTDAGGGPINANGIGIGSIIKMHIDFLNLEQNKSIPTNTFQIVIGLGDKLQLAPGANLAAAPMSNYFTWTTTTVNGQQQLLGTLNNVLPQDFAGLAMFDIQAVALGTSTSVSQLMLSNFNPGANLTDPDPSNNNAQLQYTVTAILPVTFTGFDLAPVGCEMNASWQIENQVNIDRYEVEISKTGTSFTKIATVTATNTSNYKTKFSIPEVLKASVIYARVKAIGKDGNVFYTGVKAVDGDCKTKQPWQLYVFPNPVSNVDFISVSAREGNLEGKYRLTLLDNFGKVYQVKEMTFGSVNSFRYQLSPMMGAGKYILQVVKLDGSNSTSLEFDKF